MYDDDDDDDDKGTDDDDDDDGESRCGEEVLVSVLGCRWRSCSCEKDFGNWRNFCNCS